MNTTPQRSTRPGDRGDTVEVVPYGELTEPGDVLAVAARARHDDTHIVFRGHNRYDAEFIYNTLNPPFREHTEHGVELYDAPTLVRFSDDSIPVIPDGVGAVQWAWQPSGHLALYAGSNRIAHGPLTEPVAEFKYHCPRLIVDDDQLLIVGPDGYPSAIPRTEQLSLDGYRPVSHPFIPTAIHYLSHTTVEYLVDGEFTTYTPPFADIVQSSAARADWASLIESFIDRYTIPAPAHELPLTQLTPAFRAWVTHTQGLDASRTLGVTEPAVDTVNDALTVHPDFTVTTMEDETDAVLRDRAFPVPDDLPAHLLPLPPPR